MDKERTRITMRSWVNSGLKAVAEFFGNTNRDELADSVLGGWLKKHFRYVVDGETFLLDERPDIEIDGDDVRIVKVDLEEGGESL